MHRTNTTWTDGDITISKINFTGQSIHYYMSDSDDFCEHTAVFQPNWINGSYADGWLVTNDWELMELKKSVPDAIRAFRRWLNTNKEGIWTIHDAGTCGITAKLPTADANAVTARISGNGVNPGI